MTTVAYPRIVSIGECMIEVRLGNGRDATVDHGGDTLNTAVYLARLGMHVDYLTAVGDDFLSDRLVSKWQAEGVGTSMVTRIADAHPGLYMIDTDPSGERRFAYWRNASAAKHYFQNGFARSRGHATLGYDVVYLSGISLSLLSRAGWDTLAAELADVRRRGGWVMFDSNYRAKLWPNARRAQDAYAALLPMVSILSTGEDDEVGLYGASEDPIRRAIDRAQAFGVGEVIVKRSNKGCVVAAGGVEQKVPAFSVNSIRDTTAAGDSFNAAYLAARLSGERPNAAARAGHSLASTVIQHMGAIIPRDGMPELA